MRNQYEEEKKTYLTDRSHSHEATMLVFRRMKKQSTEMIRAAPSCLRVRERKKIDALRDRNEEINR